MISEWDIYWITRLDDIRMAAFIAMLAAFVCLVFIAVALLAEDHMPDGKRRALKMLIKVLLPVSVIMGCVWVFTPGAKEMVAIKVIPAVVNSETAHRVTHETVEAALRLIEKVGKGD